MFRSRTPSRDLSACMLVKSDSRPTRFASYRVFTVSLVAITRRALAISLLVTGLCGLALAVLSTPAASSSHHAGSIVIDGAIDPVTARFLSRGLDVATDGGAEFLIVSLDTPGGLLSSTTDMVEDILESEIPVVVYVSPPGAQAASAGTFITAAAHVAAMAPATNIGAASPVGPTGEDLPETLERKATQNAAASIRSIAEERGRNAEALEATVLEAVSYSASEALEEDIIDLIAKDTADLLTQLDGRAVVTKKGEVVFATQDIEVREIERTLIERFLGVLADPNIAFLLITVGGLGIMIEFLSPGVIFPGVVGVIALALGFVALGNLPVNWVGFGLIAFAMLLFFLEMQAPGIGVFGIGGAVAFVLGAFLLFGGFSPPAIPTPSFRVSYWVIGVVSGVLFGMLALFVRLVLFTKAPPMPTTLETLLGVTGVVYSDLDPKGMVQVESELWTAESQDGKVIGAGERVIVTDLDGLTLKVIRADE